MDALGFATELSAARTYLTLTHPFYSALLANFKVVGDPAAATAYVTDRDAIHINGVFFHELGDVRKRAFLLAHEILHAALGVFWRSRGHDARLSNIAHDLVVNALLRAEQLDWMPAEALFDETLAGLPYESIYAILAKDVAKAASFKVWAEDLRVESGSGCRTGAGVDGEEKAKLWARRMVEADLFARAHGRRSAAAERLIRDSLTATTPWQELLRAAAVEARGRSSDDWSRPHRRTEALGFFQPKRISHGFETAVYVDSSGSISAENLQVAVAEIRRVLQLCGGRLRCMEGDAAILRDEWIDAAPVKINGGGGTSFVPLFDHLRLNPPRLLVVFTDTFGEMPAVPPSFPVIWAVYRSVGTRASLPVVPFGEVIPVPESAPGHL